MKKILLLFFFFTISFPAFVQQFVRGGIVDERNTPIPFAIVYVKNASEQRTVADINGKYELSMMPGEYFLIFSATGFNDRETYVTLNNLDITKNMQLFPTKIKELESIEVSVKKSNPGRDIMMEVVKKREQINPWNYSHIVDVYIKATEKLDPKLKEKQTNEPTKTDADPLENDKKKKGDWTDKMNLVEVQLTRNYAPGDKVKEIRNAYTLRGNAQSLYYTTTVKSNFNFFENLLHLDDLHQTPVSSPISSPGILS